MKKREGFMKKLSIIIPHKNDSIKLHKLIETIPDIESIEVIIVDDYSKSSVFDEVQRVYSDHHLVKVIKNTGIKSAGAARNVGLLVANGEWVIFADSDDYFLEKWYDKCNKFFDSASDIIFFPPTSQEISSTRHKYYCSLIDDFAKDKNHRNELILRVKFHVPWSKMIKKSLIDKYGIMFDEVECANDVNFSIKCGIKAKSIEVFQEPMYCITESINSITKRRTESDLITRFNVYVDSQKLLKFELSKKDYHKCCESVLRWFNIAMRERLSCRYYILVTGSMIRNQLPMKLFGRR